MSRKPDDVQTELAELRATVSGITQELVELNERVRELEARLDAGSADGDKAPTGEDRSTATREPVDESEASGSEFDDIIVA